MYTRASLVVALFTSIMGFTQQEAPLLQGIPPEPDALFLPGALAPARCPLPGDPGPGDHTLWVEHDGMTRTYEIHVPATYDGAIPTPLVVGLHGFASSAAQHARLSGMNDVSDREGFIAIYPSGFAGSWNAGECCGAASVAGLDDAGFVVEAVEDAASRLCLDTERVYLSGTSNGGMLAHRLACEQADLFAAVAVVSGRMPASFCMPSRPVPLVAFHDALSDGFTYEAGEEGFLTWASLDGCTGSPVRTTHTGSFCDTFEACDGGASLSFCTLDPVWGPSLGATAGQDPDVSFQAWSFLSTHSLP
jgi:polyhydroxybutyrate depolymerase